MAFEILDRPLMFLCGGAAGERAEVPPLPSFGIDFARIQPILARFEFADHPCPSFPGGMLHARKWRTSRRAGPSLKCRDAKANPLPLQGRSLVPAVHGVEVLRVPAGPARVDAVPVPVVRRHGEESRGRRLAGGVQYMQGRGQSGPGRPASRRVARRVLEDHHGRVNGTDLTCPAEGKPGEGFLGLQFQSLRQELAGIQDARRGRRKRLRGRRACGQLFGEQFPQPASCEQ